MSKLYSYFRKFILFLLVPLFSFPGVACGGSGNDGDENHVSLNTNYIALHGAMNILVIGEEGVGKSKMAASLLKNVKNVRPSNNVQIGQDGLPRDRFIAAVYNKNVRVIELRVEEFLNPSSEHDMGYLIDNISWVVYVVDENEKNCRVDRMLEVYDKINKHLCDQRGISYQPFSKYLSRDWWNNLNNLQVNSNYNCFYSFVLVVNRKTERMDDSLISTYQAMPNASREVIYTYYSNDNVIPIIPPSLIELLKGGKGIFVSNKQPWSHKEYFQSCWSQLWRKIGEFLYCCCMKKDNIEFWSYNYDKSESYLKNQEGTNNDCSIF